MSFTSPPRTLPPLGAKGLIGAGGIADSLTKVKNGGSNVSSGVNCAWKGGPPKPAPQSTLMKPTVFALLTTGAVAAWLAAWHFAVAFSNAARAFLTRTEIGRA